MSDTHRKNTQGTLPHYLLADDVTVSPVTQADPLPVSPVSVLSDANSTETPLSGSATFTGTGELNGHSDVMVSVATDQNGTLKMQFSHDGTNWDATLTYQYDTARINPPHKLIKGYRYYRTVFVNDSTNAQTYLRLNTSYGDFDTLTSSINGTMAENFDAIAVRPTDYHYEVAAGKRQGRTTVNKWGHNEDIDSASGFEILAPWGGTFAPGTDIITTAQTFTVTYTNTSDGSGTTGALSLLFTYIDEDFLTQTGTHTLGSSGSDTTSFSGIGINRVVVLSNGGDGYNAADITITATTDGTTQALIPTQSSVTQQCIFHTQINHTLMLDWLFYNVLKLSGASPVVEVKGYSWSRVTLTRYEVFHAKIDTSAENTVELAPSQPFVLGGREVFWLEASTDTNDTEVEARFSGIEERVL